MVDEAAADAPSPEVWVDRQACDLDGAGLSVRNELQMADDLPAVVDGHEDTPQVDVPVDSLGGVVGEVE